MNFEDSISKPLKIFATIFATILLKKFLKTLATLALQDMNKLIVAYNLTV